MRFIIALACIGLVSAPSAYAADCESPGSQTEMTDCAQAAYKLTDAALNDHYNEIKDRVKRAPVTTEQLVTAQRAWLAFRDAECTFAASGVDGGSIYGYVHTTCLNRLTKQRVKQLEAYLECEEGDLACPTP